MEKYLRFGAIPVDERSWNFIENKKEEGVSVFKLDKTGMPVLETLNNVQDLATRVDLPCFEVTGENVGVGFGGEPLIKNLKVLKKRRINKDKFKLLILKFMFSHFRRSDIDEACASETFEIFQFHTKYKVNLITGEKVSEFEEVDWSPDITIKTPSEIVYKFLGWSFYEPVLKFDTRLGKLSYEDESKKEWWQC